MTATAEPHTQVAAGRCAWRAVPRLALSVCVIAVACSSPRPISVGLEGGSADAAAAVRVTGLSADELAALRAAVWREEAWQTLLAVTVSGGDGTPVVGRYVAGKEALEFHPRFPFDPGRAYHVRFDPARLPTPRAGAAVETTVALPARAPTPPTVVTAVSPSSDAWPANTLRFYVHFSAPMSQTQGVEFVRILDDKGQVVQDALLPSAIDFWNADRTRYTVFFDPGRVKRGILPNRTLGRALEAGRDYTVVVDAAWRDAEGRPLAESYRRPFRSGPPVERALALTDWRISAPRAGTLEALVVAFPHPLDEGLLHRAVGVAPAGEGPIDGAVTIPRGEMEWRFAPARPWRAGRHEVLVLSILEDPSGNRLGRAFEVMAREAEDEPPPPEQLTLPFAIK
jgi:hypothetical protein